MCEFCLAVQHWLFTHGVERLQRIIQTYNNIKNRNLLHITLKSIWYLNEMDVVVHVRKLLEVGSSLLQLDDLVLQLQLQLFSLSHCSLLPSLNHFLHQRAFFLYGWDHLINSLIKGLHCSLGATLFVQTKTWRTFMLWFFWQVIMILFIDTG